MRAEAKTKAIAGKTRDDMQVNVKNFLAGGRAIGQEEVNALAAQVGAPERRGQPLGQSKEMRAYVRVQIGQGRGVDIGDDEGVAGIDGLNIHEGGAVVVVMDEAGR